MPGETSRLRILKLRAKAHVFREGERVAGVPFAPEAARPRRSFSKARRMALWPRRVLRAFPEQAPFCAHCFERLASALLRPGKCLENRRNCRDAGAPPAALRRLSPLLWAIWVLGLPASTCPCAKHTASALSSFVYSRIRANRRYIYGARKVPGTRRQTPRGHGGG